MPRVRRLLTSVPRGTHRIEHAVHPHAAVVLRLQAAQLVLHLQCAVIEQLDTHVGVAADGGAAERRAEQIANSVKPYPLGLKYDILYQPKLV